MSKIKLQLLCSSSFLPPLPSSPSTSPASLHPLLPFFLPYLPFIQLQEIGWSACDLPVTNLPFILRRSHQKWYHINTSFNMQVLQILVLHT